MPPVLASVWLISAKGPRICARSEPPGFLTMDAAVNGAEPLSPGLRNAALVHPAKSPLSKPPLLKSAKAPGANAMSRQIASSASENALVILLMALLDVMCPPEVGLAEVRPESPRPLVSAGAHALWMGRSTRGRGVRPGGEQHMEPDRVDAREVLACARDSQPSRSRSTRTRTPTPAMQEEAAALIADWCSRARRTSPPAAETATPTLLKRVHCRYRLSVAKGLA